MEISYRCQACIRSARVFRLRRYGVQRSFQHRPGPRVVSAFSTSASAQPRPTESAPVREDMSTSHNHESELSRGRIQRKEGEPRRVRPVLSRRRRRSPGHVGNLGSSPPGHRQSDQSVLRKQCAAEVAGQNQSTGSTILAGSGKGTARPSENGHDGRESGPGTFADADETFSWQQRKIAADLISPLELFPGPRTRQRTIHLHVGPTNSGKTYQALKRLEAAETGVYAGPLRLLAHEVYTRLKAKGRLCALRTGDERIQDGPIADIISCTVEMVPESQEFDVVVIDEIQMIGHAQRGWAWTRALLGLRAKEIHLCGEARCIPLIQSLMAAVGDIVEIHHHERLSPLKPMQKSLGGDLGNLRKGDALILFSRAQIHRVRADLERQTGRQCAVVYGSLPAQTRAAQANLFNDPENRYDLLLASDAIGMGLNLSIKRVVFVDTVTQARGALTTSEIKQIAGRAGRYRTANQSLVDDESNIPSRPGSTGLVTTLHDKDLPVVQHAMSIEPKPISTAGFFPLVSTVQRFAAYFPPTTPFSHILRCLRASAQVHRLFHLCIDDEILGIAEAVDDVKNLSIQDRVLLCSAPARRARNVTAAGVTKAFARAIAKCTSGSLLDFPEIPLAVLDRPISNEPHYFQLLEQLHQNLTLYLWLGYRFQGVFVDRALARHVKELVEEKINQVLALASSSRSRGVAWRRISLASVPSKSPRVSSLA